MTLQNDTESLSAALEDMQSRSRALNDSLRALAEDGFGRLGRAAAQHTRASGRGEGAADIAAQELARVLKAEMGEAMRQVFSPAPGRGNDTGGALSVVIYNHTPAQVSARESAGPFDRKTLEITIDQMVAQSLTHGRQTGSVLQNLFGLAPSLIGR